MQKKLYIPVLFVALLFIIPSCDKTVSEPVSAKQKALPLDPTEPEFQKPLLSNVPLNGTYLLYKIRDIYDPNTTYTLPTNYLPYKDSLTISFTAPNLMQIGMRLKKTFSYFVDSCGIYTASGKLTTGLATDSINFSELSGKYGNYCNFCMNPYPIPYWNVINNFRCNGDTLKLNLYYRCHFWTQGKPSGWMYYFDMTFVKT